MTQTLLITGGAGFIGSNLCHHWVRNHPDHRVICYDKLTYAGNLSNLEELLSSPHFQFVRGDIADEETVNELFERASIDLVIHLAAESHVDRSIEDPGVFLETNIRGTFVLLRACLAAWKKRGSKRRPRFVHVSTDEVFGSLGPREAPFCETSRYKPNSPYAASKAAADHLVRSYWKTYGLPCLITNCSNNYGPYQFPEKLIPLMIHNLIERRPLPVYGDGKNVRDWIHVEDHCRALETVALNGTPGETFTIGAGDERRNIDLVHILCDVVDQKLGREAGESRRLIRFVEDRAGHDKRYAIDSTKIRTELAWQPCRPFSRGLQ